MSDIDQREAKHREKREQQAIQYYEAGCLQILDAFLHKYFVDEETTLDDISCDWVRDKIGDVLNIGDYWLDMENMVDALRLNVPVDTFFAWYDQWMESEHKKGELRYNLEHYNRLQTNP